MDRSKQETEAAVSSVMDLIDSGLKGTSGPPFIHYGVKLVKRAGPNTFRAVMENKREIVVTVRGL